VHQGDVSKGLDYVQKGETDACTASFLSPISFRVPFTPSLPPSLPFSQMTYKRIFGLIFHEGMPMLLYAQALIWGEPWRGGREGGRGPRGAH
jgi:hypothetical protein